MYVVVMPFAFLSLLGFFWTVSGFLLMSHFFCFRGALSVLVGNAQFYVEHFPFCSSLVPHNVVHVGEVHAFSFFLFSCMSAILSSASLQPS